MSPDDAGVDYDSAESLSSEDEDEDIEEDEDWLSKPATQQPRYVVMDIWVTNLSICKGNSGKEIFGV